MSGFLFYSWPGKVHFRNQKMEDSAIICAAYQIFPIWAVHEALTLNQTTLIGYFLLAGMRIQSSIQHFIHHLNLMDLSISYADRSAGRLKCVGRLVSSFKFFVIYYVTLLCNSKLYTVYALVMCRLQNFTRCRFIAASFSETLVTVYALKSWRIHFITKTHLSIN